MDRSLLRRTSGFVNPAKKSRRPAGVSRRRKKQLGFETLEDRRVMTTQSPVASLSGAVDNNLALQMASYSSATPEGAAEIMARELYWQGLISAQNSSGVSPTTIPLSIPNDPLFGKQWHLINTGQQVGNPDYQAIYGVPGADINVAPVWNQGIFGNGVVVAVLDSGIQLNHPDLAANIDASRGFDAINPQGNGSPRIDPFNTGTAHGTAVAGLIGAVANNGIGGSGVAPGVTLIPIHVIDTGSTTLGIVNSFRFATQNGVDITNNSWGFVNPGGRELAGLTGAEMLALRDSIMFGRDGKGMINVFASGNDGGPRYPIGFSDITGDYDSAAYEGYLATRYTIAVGGVDHDGEYSNVDGTVTNYPMAGPNLMVVAPTGSVPLEISDETSIGSGIVTTDLTGENGFNRAPLATGEEIDRDFLPDTDYTSRFNGTSAADPMVSGVIALMLEANPDLTWRDVQEILVRSARQNAEFELPHTGDVANGAFQQNSWITNYQPIFQDPDPYQSGTSRFQETFSPTYDPMINVPQMYTNGAGYTVSQGYGVYGELMGYGHGEIDADMAVKLAQQWSTKNQMLAPELTFTTYVAPQNLNIPPAGRGSQDSGFQLIPGRPGGAAGNVAFWNEYFVQTPNFAQNFPTTGLPFLEFSVPDDNAMSVETVDVKISISGAAAAALDNMRMLLVSPDGTQSELNHYWYNTPIPVSIQNEVGIPNGSPGSVDRTGGNLVWNFTTNRNWGEQAGDATVYDPRTGDPVGTRGWRLYIENWSTSATFGLDGLEISWHGSPIQAATQRVQGFVGIDENRDDLFNYSRVILTDNSAGGVTHLGDFFSTQDLSQEAFAANQTVSVRRTSDNALVDQFVTGADGNFYFDLVPDDYIVTVEDPLGRVAQDDSLTPSTRLAHYQDTWHITPEFFQSWTHDANREVVVDASGVPVPFAATAGTPEGIKGINFLLDPGNPPPQEATFQGTVYADTNGDGQFNSYDVALSNITIFGDVNRNGQRDAGEVTTTTDAVGHYSLTVPSIGAATVLNIGVVRPTNWTSTGDGPSTNDSANDGLESFFVVPGASISGVDFRIKPPTTNNAGGGGANQPGFLLGYVFEDVNGDGVQQTTDKGIGGIRVYIDANNSGVFDAGDTGTITNQFGAYAFGSVAPGQRILRTDVASPFVRTLPANNAARILSLVGSSTISGITFGVRNTAIVDYGDLPALYHATLAGDTTVSPLGGASHVKGAYWLGGRVDAELNGAPSIGADGDDSTGVPDDEDGIDFVTPLTPGTNATIKATASRNGGYLQAWADWNNDGDFNDAGERIITNRLLDVDASSNFISFAVPASAGAQVYLRFRYGEFATAAKNINTPYGPAASGEVEDYLRTVPVLPAVVAGIPADFDQDSDVDGSDFLNWQRNAGRTTAASQSVGNANGDSKVDGNDLTEWNRDFGKTSSAALVLETGDFDGDEDVDGSDFLTLQRGYGATVGAFVTQGDGNADRKVDSVDMGIWLNDFGRHGLSTTQAASGAVAVASFGAQHTTAAAALTLDDVAVTTAVAQHGITDSTPADRTTVGAATRERVAAARRLIHTTLADAASTTPSADYNFLRRDRAFDDLFGSRRRQGLRTDADGAEAETVTDCDEAFAVLADHFERPLG